MTKSFSLIPAICVFMVASAFSQAPASPDVREGAAPRVVINYETARLDRVARAVRISEPMAIDGRLDEPAWQTAEPATKFMQWAREGELGTEQSDVRFLYDDANLYIGFVCFDSDIEHRVVNEIRKDFNFRDTDSISILIDSLHDRRSGFLFSTSPAGARRDGLLSNDGSLSVDWDGVWDVRVTVDDDRWTSEFIIPFKTLRFIDTPKQEWGLNLSRRLLRKTEETEWSPIPRRYTATKISLAGTLVGIEDIHQGNNLYIKPYMNAGINKVRDGDHMRTTRSLTRFKDYDGGVDGKFSLTPSLTLDATYRTDFAQVEADQQQVNLTRFNLFFPEKRDFFLENAATFNFGPGGNLLPFFSRRIGLNANGDPIPIDGGARVTGKVRRYDLGFLTMKTQDLGATPSNKFLVGRVKRNLLVRSYVGGIFTNRDSTIDGDYNRVYGSDAHFVFHDKLEFDSYLLKSDTPKLTDKNQARRFETAWRDNNFTIVGEYNAIQTNFNPEVGFVRRGNNSQYSGEFTWKPKVSGHPEIRNLVIGTTADYFQGGNSKVETRTQDLTLGIAFENNSNVTFKTLNTFDRLIRSARIQGLPIPVGDYDYLSYTASFNTNAAKKLSTSGTFEWGDFWDGRQKSLTSGVILKPDYRLNLTLSFTRNIVDFPRGSSTADLASLRFLFGFNPRSFMNAFFQYNGTTKELSTNIRYNITYRPLSDIYVVYNERRNLQASNVMERAIIVKVTRLFNF